MGECNPSMASGYGSPILNCVGLFLSGVIRKRNTNGEKGEFPTRKLDPPKNRWVNFMPVEQRKKKNKMNKYRNKEKIRKPVRKLSEDELSGRGRLILQGIETTKLISWN
jgi:hypothetical protein